MIGDITATLAHQLLDGLGDGTLVEHGSMVECIADVLELDDPPESVMVLARARKGLVSAAAHLEEVGEPYRHERGPSPMGQGVLISIIRAIHGLQAGRLITAADARRLADKLPARRKADRAAWFGGGAKKAAMERIKERVESGGLFGLRGLAGVGVTVDLLVEAAGRDEFGRLRTALELIGLGDDCVSLLRIVDRHGIRVLSRPARWALTTIHASKGREAPCVVLNCGATAFTRPGDEDERRVLYVGLTRSSDALYLARAGEDLLWMLG